LARRIRSRGVGRSVAHGHLRRGDQRTASAYIFGAICPQHGKGAGLVLPSCNTEAMALHLEEIAAAVAPGATRHSRSRSSWMARLEDAPSAAQHYTRVIAAEIARTQPGRKYLAVHEGQLAVKPSLHLLREHRRPLLLCLEQTGRPAMADHVHRNSPVGKPVMLLKTWY